MGILCSNSLLYIASDIPRRFDSGLLLMLYYVTLVCFMLLLMLHCSSFFV